MRTCIAIVVVFLLSSCSSMRYDLDGLPFPVTATPAATTDGEAFELDSKYVMYVHGLLGEKQPKVRELLLANFDGAKAVSDFRVGAGANFWDWLGTHLSLGLVRLKSVRISGTVHR